MRGWLVITTTDGIKYKVYRHSYGQGVFSTAIVKKVIGEFNSRSLAIKFAGDLYEKEKTS